MWGKNSVTVIYFFFHINPTFYSLNFECLWCVLAPGLSLSIIITLLSMCGTKIKSILVCTLIVGLTLLITKGREQVSVIHVDVCMRTTQSQQSYITYDFTFHVYILRFHWDFFIFYFMRRKRGPTYNPTVRQMLYFFES